MLRLMRDYATSWMIKFLLGAIVIVFVFWGVGSFKSERANRVAVVNGETITVDDFRQHAGNFNCKKVLIQPRTIFFLDPKIFVCQRRWDHIVEIYSTMWNALSRDYSRQAPQWFYCWTNKNVQQCDMQANAIHHLQTVKKSLRGFPDGDVYV